MAIIAGHQVTPSLDSLASYVIISIVWGQHARVLYTDGVEDVPPPDAVPPVITFVSPTPGVAPGAAGGFPADPTAAKNTPIVIALEDTDPGLQYVCVSIAYTNELGETIEETVYRRANFRGKYVKGSTAVMVGDALQLSIKREGGWLELIKGSSTGITFSADAIDQVGNVSAES